MRAPANMKNAAARSARQRRGFMESSLKEMKIQNREILRGLKSSAISIPGAFAPTALGVSQFPSAPIASAPLAFRVSTRRSEKPRTFAPAERNQHSRRRSSDPRIEHLARWDKRAPPIA